MYGSDDGMVTVSESSDEENTVGILQPLEGRIVSTCALSSMSHNCLTSE